MSDSSAPLLLDCRDVSVRFGGVVALSGVDFSLQPGEVHGLVGCNGAGKSTLMKVLAGVVPEYTGEIRLDGRLIRLSSPREALSHGIAMVYQELSGIEQLSVVENLFLGRQLVNAWGQLDWREMTRQATAALAELDIQIDVRRRLRDYPLVIRQMIEIARGLHSGARVLILDEPTSALSPPEARRLFELIKHLQTRGVAMVFISHFLEDVLAICNRVTILKDGRKLRTSLSRDLDRATIIREMVGDVTESTSEECVETALPVAAEGAARLEIRGLMRSRCFESISLDVKPGECLGLYGFVGAGHQDLVHALGGSVNPEGGQILVDGKPIRTGDVASAVGEGVVLVAADRAQTLARRAPISHNTTLAHLRRTLGNWIVRRRENQVCQPLLERVGCNPPNPALRAGALSGGNQQKVVLAKWLLGPIRVLLLEEPTRGMDVHAKAEIMELVAEQKRQGAAVVLASTEPELVLAYSDRIVTLARGRVTRVFSGERVTKQDLMRCAEVV
ncbi:sugar ABC transporter ATP-binding protein [Schlesneria paludicola]|uniref:sugar ABC transporter ATP-binding protein n=1 Tax=Schlesneria paludicola TaxID=360056 RepID=UPI00029AC6B0|nr:sugar ABC transporter ATP-binding protein [Schlesneria paludicola]